uniref:CtaA protein n=1 Tax=Fopius arisanus TaxID=64838 RepID=A0A0C9RBB7_9HYME
MPWKFLKFQLWTTSSVLLGVFVSFLAVILVGLIVLWTLCCGKHRKNSSNFPETEISPKQPLIPPLDSQSDLEELIWERPKKKKKKLVRRLLSKDEEQPLVYGINLLPKKKTNREKIKTIPVCCIDSYRSHGGHCPDCKNPHGNLHGRAHKRPPVPFPDFDR